MAALHKDLRQEFEFYLANQADMVKKYRGRVIVLKGQKVLGVYGTHLAAFTETVKRHARGTFIIQEVSEGNEAYTSVLSTPGILAAQDDLASV